MSAHPVVLRLVDLDRYVVACDVDARDGRGVLVDTPDQARATVFPSAFDALEYWKRQSTRRPLRDDGKPNRPLTAFTVEVVPVEAPVPATH